MQANLKAMKALFIINFEQPNPFIIESIKSFIEYKKKSDNFIIVKLYPMDLSYDIGDYFL